MKKILVMLIFIAIGIAAAYFGQPAVSKNQDLILIIVTVFTVFAGFLIAIITIIGDPVMIPEGSWRIAENGREEMTRRLELHISLFISYLVVIGVLFTGVVLEKTLDEQNQVHVVIKLWVERVELFAGVTSFLFTFLLPSGLIRMQRARYDAELERRRVQVGMGSEPPAGPPVSSA